MVLKIVNKNGNKYYLESNEGKHYEHSFKFFDLPKEPDAGDYINIKPELMDKNFNEYNDLYLFGPIAQKYGRSVKTGQEIDVISLKIGDKAYYLKRFFG